MGDDGGRDARDRPADARMPPNAERETGLEPVVEPTITSCLLYGVKLLADSQDSADPIPTKRGLAGRL